jgi:hypothetical protein
MSRVEQRLEIVPPEKEMNDEVVNVLPIAQLLDWVEQLTLPELCQQERLKIAAQLKQSLSLAIPLEHSPPVALAELVQ